MDNITTQPAQADNSVAQGSASGAAPATTTTAAPQGSTTAASASASGGWKTSLRTDLRDSTLLQKFDDTPAGLEKAIESHANLEKLLGNDKVPIPKDINDVEGWNRFSKAMGIPDKAEGYGLADVQMPPDFNGEGPNKNKFAEIAHAHKLTPAQAQGLWNEFNKNGIETYNGAIEAQRKSLETTINTLKSKWGDAYQTNVELGQMVINKFSADAETNDYITAVLSQDPRGIAFLAKIGDQFAENKVGEFSMKRFTLSPEQAREEWMKITRDQNHPYNNDKATPRERQAAIDYVNSLIATANKGQG